MLYVNLNKKIKIAYTIIGELKAGRPILLFLHEGMGSILQFKNFPEKLCSELNLPGLVFDRYGYGFSTPLQEERSDEYLEYESRINLPLFLEKLKLQNRELILIGHSDGASIALLYASMFPENVKALVSMAAHVFTENISITSAHALENKYYSNEIFRKKLSKYHFGHTESTLLAFTRTIKRESFKQWNIESYLGYIKAPVLVIQGEEDKYGTESQVDSIMKHCKNKNNKKVIIEKCGHSPHLEKQEFVLNKINEFLLILN
ncbi:MAG: alpha/beta hydrolase [Sphingobacteriaceae bacterium]|nr:alpha/beta hydrolase [Sphingobacteriaceae bacterium]